MSPPFDIYIEAFPRSRLLAIYKSFKSTFTLKSSKAYEYPINRLVYLPARLVDGSIVVCLVYFDSMYIV